MFPYKKLNQWLRLRCSKSSDLEKGKENAGKEESIKFALLAKTLQENRPNIRDL